MKFLTKVKDWFIAHKPTKRRLIQLYAALLTNANFKGFFTGDIYTGDTKKMCVPGLNCYSCPGAVGACPMGALQDSLADSGKRAPAYILGILLLFGLLLGRVICGFLCPFGFVQDLLYKIRTPKLRKSRFTRVLSYFKYVVLAAVIALSVIFAAPVFCEYVCPAGMLGGAVPLLSAVKNTGFYGILGYLFTWKFCLAVVIIVASVFIYRFLCRFLCPLGAIYSFFNRISLLGVKLDRDKCIDCGLCIQGCKMDIRHVGDHECINCGECIPVCPVQAISWKGSKIFVHNTAPSVQPVESEGIPLLQLAKNNASEAAGAVPCTADGGNSISAPVEDIKSEAGGEQVENVTAQQEETEAGVEEILPATEEVVEDGGKEGRAKARGVAIKAAFKRPRFVVEFVAWVVALAVLLAAIIIYNRPEKKLEGLSDITFATYQTAASDGKDYTAGADGHRLKVWYFWSTDFADSVENMQTIIDLAESTVYDADVVAVHTYIRDGRDVKAFIYDKGWNESKVIFAQDEVEKNVYSRFGGDTTVPSVITVVGNAQDKIVKQINGKVTADELNEALKEAHRSSVYDVGDKCPVFTVECYKSAGCDGGTLSSGQLKGKVTVINFWYTSCVPCKKELPDFEKIYEEYDGAINMVVIHNVQSVPASGVQNFLDNGGEAVNSSYRLTFAQDSEEQGVAAMMGDRGVYPFTLVVNAEGYITYKVIGQCSEKTLKEQIELAKNK